MYAESHSVSMVNGALMRTWFSAEPLIYYIFAYARHTREAQMNGMIRSRTRVFLFTLGILNSMASLAVPRFHGVYGRQRTIRMKRLGANETISTCAFTLELCITGTSFIGAAIITWKNDNMTFPIWFTGYLRRVVCLFNFAQCKILRGRIKQILEPHIPIWL